MALKARESRFENVDRILPLIPVITASYVTAELFDDDPETALWQRRRLDSVR
jgi:hypothetical protein